MVWGNSIGYIRSIGPLDGSVPGTREIRPEIHCAAITIHRVSWRWTTHLTTYIPASTEKYCQVNRTTRAPSSMIVGQSPSCRLSFVLLPVKHHLGQVNFY